jgi:hypothetical protein
MPLSWSIMLPFPPFFFFLFPLFFPLYSTRFVFALSLFIKNYSPFVSSKTLILFSGLLTCPQPAVYFRPSIHGEFSSQRIHLSHYARGRRELVFIASTPIVAPLGKATDRTHLNALDLSSPSHGWSPGRTCSSPLYL